MITISKWKISIFLKIREVLKPVVRDLYKCWNVLVIENAILFLLPSRFFLACKTSDLESRTISLHRYGFATRKTIRLVFSVNFLHKQLAKGEKQGKFRVFSCSQK